MKKISVNGTELNYLEQGKGDPVIFVHGSLNDLRAWMPQIEPFSKLYRVISYSRRRHWPNSLTDDGTDYSATVHAQDLAALIEALDAGPAHIVAHSYGAYSALLLAARHPELIRTLTLAEPPLIPLLEAIPSGRPLEAAFLGDVWRPSGQAFERGDMEQGVRIFIDGVSGKGTFDRLPAPALSMIMDNVAAMAAQTLALDQFPAFTCRDAGKITAPALLLTGEKSPRMLGMIMEELRRCMPESELAIIPGVSHNMHSGNPQAFNETVLGFLAKH